MYLPTYNRGESITGYVQRCSSSPDMIKDVGLIGVRRNICKEHAEQVRVAMKQPFSQEQPKTKLGQKK